MEGAREALVNSQILWGRVPGTEAEHMVEYFDDASKVLMVDMYREGRAALRHGEADG